TKQNSVPILEILKQSNTLLPHVVIASTLLALIFPPSFTWFTSRYYAPALGFLMFAVGVNSREKDFLDAFHRPAEIVTGYFGQFVVKPLLGYLFCIISVTVFGLPTAIGAGIALVSCVSGAQLSNYATFLTDPQMAPLSIVMTSLSTASAVFITPLLSLLLIGKRLPVDVKGMVFSITQIVVAPIVAGLILNRFFPRICNAIRPFLPPLSVFVTALCVGAPLAINVESVKSPFGLSILLLVVAFHLSAFIAGYILSGFIFRDSPDVKPLQRTISYETGMQSSLLALALANRFFPDPVVAVPPAISVLVTITIPDSVSIFRTNTMTCYDEDDDEGGFRGDEVDHDNGDYVKLRWDPLESQPEATVAEFTPAKKGTALWLAELLHSSNPRCGNEVIIPIMKWVRNTFSIPELAILVVASISLFPTLLLPSSPSMWVAGMTFSYGFGFLLITSAVAGWLDQYPNRASILRAAGGGNWFHQFKAVILIRISPFPYILYNYCSVATNVKYGPYLLGSLVGMVPDIVVSLYTGILMRTLADTSHKNHNISATEIIVNVAGFCITVATIIFFTTFAKRQLELEKKDELLLQ
ncbi:hypothetical protein TanjilG_06631, partial [Lupinus angustifolius]